LLVVFLVFVDDGVVFEFIFVLEVVVVLEDDNVLELVVVDLLEIFVFCLLVVFWVFTLVEVVLVVGVVFTFGVCILIADAPVCVTGADTVLLVVLPIKLSGAGIGTCKNGTVK
jgi:hypothetical protein